MIDWNRRIWQHWSPDGRHKWPIDQQGFVYLLRAMDPVGRALFGAEWKDTEQAELPNISLRERVGDSSIFTPMPQKHASSEQKFQVYFLLRGHYGYDDSKLPPLNDGHLSFSDEQWQLALALAEEEDRRRAAARERAMRVHATIRDAVLDGTMETALRDVEGGALSAPLPAAKFWASERLWPRFGLGQLDTLDPFGPYPALPFRNLMDQARRSGKGHWRLIYVEAAGLARLVRRLDEKTPLGSAVPEEAAQEPLVEADAPANNPDLTAPVLTGMKKTRERKKPKTDLALWALKKRWEDGDIPPMTDERLTDIINETIRNHLKKGGVSVQTAAKARKLIKANPR